MPLRIAGIVCLMALAGCGALERVVSAAPEMACIVLVEQTSRDVDGSSVITGSVRNDCDRPFGNVTITFNPGATGYIRNLKRGESKAFETKPVALAKDTSFRFDKITAD